jgi:NAD(P) transhydrogenase subunit beta
MVDQNLVNVAYLIAAVLFIFDLRWMAHPKTAVRGNAAGVLGMAIAIVATLVSQRFDFNLILIGVAVGTLIGAVSALRVKMTAMPEMVGLFNGFGGGASVLVAGAALIAAFQTTAAAADATLQMKIATVASGLIGSVTFFGSYVAFGKLAEFLAVKWKLYTWQKLVKYGFSAAVAGGGLAIAALAGFTPLSIVLVVTGVVIAGLLLVKNDRFPGMDVLKLAAVAGSLVMGVMVVLHPTNTMLFWVLVGVSGLLGVLLTLSRSAAPTCRS